MARTRLLRPLWLIGIGIACILVVSAGAVLYLKSLNPSLSPVAVPATFDPASTEGYLGLNNAVQMNFDQYAKSAPQLFDAQTKTLTVPLAVQFKNNQIRTLRIEKVKNPITNSVNTIIIDGLIEGDTILSPSDGQIEIFQEDQDLGAFFFNVSSSQGNSVRLIYLTLGLDPLVKIESSPTGSIVISMKKGDPIGKLISSDKDPTLNGQLQITGEEGSIQTLNLATTPQGKVIVVQ
jgi:hypothetical protein